MEGGYGLNVDESIWLFSIENGIRKIYHGDEEINFLIKEDPSLCMGRDLA